MDTFKKERGTFEDYLKEEWLELSELCHAKMVALCQSCVTYCPTRYTVKFKISKVSYDYLFQLNVPENVDYVHYVSGLQNPNSAFERTFVQKHDF